jgi:6-phosphogluconate dehydrogenase
MAMKVGIIGLGVMGRNLALNACDGAFQVLATDSWEDARNWSAPGVEVVPNTAKLAAALPAPRIILLMVKAGEQVDAELGALSPHLSPGDIVIDGGNSHYRDTARRATDLRDRGFEFLGLGVSGGAEGARNGAALMAGGSSEAFAGAEPFLLSIAARSNDGAPTLALFGEGGAGHFVKMVHNGIEYAIMQAIAECHGLLTNLAGLDREAVASVFDRWNANGRASGFLLEITAEIARTRDPLTEDYMLDHISDVAGQKGTGAWSVEAGLAFGVPLPSIMEAVCARQISGQRGARETFQRSRGAAKQSRPADGFVEDLEQALVATMIVSLAQGLHLYAAAAEKYGWQVDLPAVLRVWRAGSILRMDLLESLAKRLEKGGNVVDPLSVSAIADDLAPMLPALRRIAAACVEAGCPSPVLLASLAYLDALGTSALPTAMVQAQRDRFGAHRFERNDRDGVHHGPWVHPDGTTAP